MKRNIYALLLLLAVSACKRNEFELDYSGIEPIVLVPNSNWPGKSPYEPQPADSVYGVSQLNLYARMSYAEPLSQPVKVSFKPAPELLDDYNQKWGTAYELLPAESYDIPSLDVVIPAGARQAALPIKIISDKIMGDHDYFVAFTISSAAEQTIASNAKTIIFTLKGQ